MEIKVLNSQKDISRWDSYIQKSPDATFYHFFGWKTIIEKSFGYEPVYLAAEEDGIKGALPLFYVRSLLGDRLVSLPMANYGGICADSPRAEELLIEEAIRITKKYKADYLELRHIKPADNSALHAKTHKQTFIFELRDDYSALWDQFTPEIRNRIRKAEKSGLEIKIGGKGLLSDFYFVYSRHMKEIGVPVLPKVFFENILLNFPDNVKIFIIHSKGDLIGGALVVFSRDTIEAPWISSLGRYFSYCPNNLMYWGIIKYGCENKFKYFDFGRSTRDSSHAVFKIRWGAKPIDLVWQYYFSGTRKPPEMTQDNPKVKLAVEIWKRLPVSFTNFVGPKISRHLPY